LFIEQVRGWSGIQATIPKIYGIEAVSNLTFEYLLNLDVMQNRLNRKEIKKELDKNKIEWNKINDYMESLLQFIEIFNPEEEYAIQKNQESEEKTEKKFTVPQKIKILDKLNIKGWLQGKGYTNYQIEILLSNLFDRTDKTIRDGFSNNKHEKSANEYLEELKNLKANRN
jgi:hypothetical protein